MWQRSQTLARTSSNLRAADCCSAINTTRAINKHYLSALVFLMPGHAALACGATQRLKAGFRDESKMALRRCIVQPCSPTLLQAGRSLLSLVYSTGSKFLPSRDFLSRPLQSQGTETPRQALPQDRLYPLSEPGIDLTGSLDSCESVKILQLFPRDVSVGLAESAREHCLLTQCLWTHSPGIRGVKHQLETCSPVHRGPQESPNGIGGSGRGPWILPATCDTSAGSLEEK